MTAGRASLQQLFLPFSFPQRSVAADLWGALSSLMTPCQWCEPSLKLPHIRSGFFPYLSFPSSGKATVTHPVLWENRELLVFLLSPSYCSGLHLIYLLAWSFHLMVNGPKSPWGLWCWSPCSKGTELSTMALPGPSHPHQVG